MSILPLVIIPDPILRQKSKLVERVDEDVRKFADDMLETMYDAPGVGLAAIQVGEARRMLVLDVAGKDDEPEPQVFINPTIVKSSDTPNVYEEGCLSIPDVYAEVERPAEVTVEYIDLAGEKQLVEADGILATVLQHEIDHLDGMLFIDHLSKLKREMVIRKFKKLSKQREAKL
jgi:peptide deformylase